LGGSAASRWLRARQRVGRTQVSGGMRTARKRVGRESDGYNKVAGQG